MSSNPFSLVQSYPASCAVKCQQLMLLDLGIVVTEEEACAIGEAEGWYIPGEGVYMRNNGRLLEHFGVSFSHCQHNTVDDLRRKLSLTKKVMVNVNHSRLNGDETRQQEAAHSIIVESVDDEMVHYTDTGKGMSGLKCPKAVFDRAWADSCRYMLIVPSLQKI